MSSGFGLKALEHAEHLAIHCRKAADALPAREAPLADQLRRAADSVAFNIAEGSSKGTFKDYRRFLDTSRGSLTEVRSAVRVAHGSGLIEESLYQQIIAVADETGRTLYGLIRSVSAKIERGEKRQWPLPRNNR